VRYPFRNGHTPSDRQRGGKLSEAQQEKEDEQEKITLTDVLEEMWIAISMEGDKPRKAFS
jgi:hypothetical protein